MAVTKLVTSTHFRIEKGIPIPSRATGTEFPFDEMDVGDSFAVSDADLQKCRERFAYQKRKHGRKFSLRQLPTENRCWRIA